MSLIAAGFLLSFSSVDLKEHVVTCSDPLQQVLKGVGGRPALISNLLLTHILLMTVTFLPVELLYVFKVQVNQVQRRVGTNEG